MMKPYKKLSAAVKAAGGKPFLRVGDLYIVAEDPDRHDVRYSKIAICGPNGEAGGSIAVSMIDAFSKSGYRLPVIDGVK